MSFCMQTCMPPDIDVSSMICVRPVWVGVHI